MATKESAVTQSDKVSLPTLTAMVVGSMIGSGVFLLPRRFGTETGAAGALIAGGAALRRARSIHLAGIIVILREPGIRSIIARHLRRRACCLRQVLVILAQR